MNIQEAIELTINYQYNRNWEEKKIDELQDLCEQRNISADFGIIYGAYLGTEKSDAADAELDAICDKLIDSETAEEND